MTRRMKQLILAIVDILLFGLAFYVAYLFLIFYVRVSLPVNIFVYSIVLIVYLIIGTKLKVFSRINRYTNAREIFYLVLSLTIAQLVGFALTFIFNPLTSRRIIVLTYLFSTLMIPATRLGWRFLFEHRSRMEKMPEERKRTLVVGAGDGCNILFRHLGLEGEQYQVVGIVDDDFNKFHTYLYNVPVVGDLNDIPKLVKELKVDHVIVAIPSLEPNVVEEILDHCNRMHITMNRMPSVHEILTKGFTMKQLRDVDVADLLGRDEVELDMKALANDLTEKVLLVTGAGGSIGSEICRQVGRFHPKKLVLLGHGENSIYQIHRELSQKLSDHTEIIPVIADIQDREKMFHVMEKYQPDVIYHAAAHKHVPLMEGNPIEAVKNNVYGTKNVAEAAKAAKVGKFVMISSDKAVNPPNVMGATKRVAEMIVTGLNEVGGTKFCAVRFGNVLGSRGSVVPLFKEQIAKGGPVTITDDRMTRYFMTIPEASRLVLQAGALADGGEIFVLDMGEPVRIRDLATKLIKLSGFSEEEIPVVESGIRPGEKLFEELLTTSELTEKSVHDKIFVGKVTRLPLGEVMDFVNTLEDNDQLKAKLIAFANTAHEQDEQSWNSHERGERDNQKKKLRQSKPKAGKTGYYKVHRSFS